MRLKAQETRVKELSSRESLASRRESSFEYIRADLDRIIKEAELEAKELESMMESSGLGRRQPSGSNLNRSASMSDLHVYLSEDLDHFGNSSSRGSVDESLDKTGMRWRETTRRSSMFSPEQSSIFASPKPFMSKGLNAGPSMASSLDVDSAGEGGRMDGFDRINSMVTRLVAEASQVLSGSTTSLAGKPLDFMSDAVDWSDQVRDVASMLSARPDPLLIAQVRARGNQSMPPAPLTTNVEASLKPSHSSRSRQT